MSQKQEIRSQSTQDRFKNTIKEHSLPKAWKWMKLDQVCITTKNRDPKITPDLPFRYVDISSVNNRLKRITDTHTILGKDAPSRARQIIKANDVIVSMTRPNLNAVALVPEDLNDEICSTGFCVLRPKEFIDALFLFEFVQSKYFIETVSGKVRGMLYPAITDNQVREVNIPIPPLPEQKKIAIKTQELIQIVENARIACEKQLEVAKALSSAYLREVFKSEEAKKWERKKLGKLCVFSSGKFLQKEEVKNKGLYPVYGANGVIGFTDEKIFDEEVIIIGRVGSCGTVNKNLGPAWITDNTIILQPHYQIDFDYLYWLLRSLKLEDFRAASVQPLITQKDLKPLLVPIPSLSEQKRIADYLKEKMAQVENLQSAIRNQQSLIDVLLQAILTMAFRGKL